MALINGIYVFVDGDGEDVRREVESTTHPVEQGIEITSTIRNKPLEISIRGKIVDVGSTKASEIITKIENLAKKGSLIKYVGRVTASNMQIQSFNTTHPNTNAGGADFDMSLKEVRIAKSAYTAKKTSTTTAKKKNNPDLSVGSIVVFTGGNVYISSDAKNPAVKRGRSTCKITIINSRSWAIHPYHLISTDGKMVYGWVDKSNIEGVTSDSTAAKTNGGTQQTKTGSGTSIYHTVKKGDTIYHLVNVTYKEYGVTCKEVINNNPYAFVDQGDASTLMVGARLFIATR